jgi:hypothetical protein
VTRREADFLQGSGESVVPAAGTLLYTVKGFVELEHSALCAVEALWDPDVESLFGLAVQESAFDVHLLDFEVIESAESE